MTNNEALNELDNVLESIIAVEEEVEALIEEVYTQKLAKLKILDFIADVLIEQLVINSIVQLCLTGE